MKDIIEENKMSYHINKMTLVEDGLDKFFCYEAIAYAENIDELEPRTYILIDEINRDEIKQAFSNASAVERCITGQTLILQTQHNLDVAQSQDNTLGNVMPKIKMVYVIDAQGDTPQDAIVLVKDNNAAPSMAQARVPVVNPAGNVFEEIAKQTIIVADRALAVA